MPELNRRQFTQPEIGFLDYTRTGPSSPAEPHDPGPNTKRGQVGQGQQVMNFDAPHIPLEVAQSGFVPVNEFADPDWDNSSFYMGGRNRGQATGGSHEAQTIVDGWKNAPVETIGPDDQIRTGQGKPQTPGVGSHPGFPAEVQELDEDRVAELRDVGDTAFQDPETGEQEIPWIAQVADKRYLMEGHHRGVSARTRDSGEFPAHVLRGANWGQIEEQLYDGPWER
ncbi:MAG: hypothetical protein ABR616_18770 [Dermatophilaceae bacterium]|nr:hypothetical protein [Intrasporangiaceae bacterium]